MTLLSLTYSSSLISHQEPTPNPHRTLDAQALSSPLANVPNPSSAISWPSERSFLPSSSSSSELGQVDGCRSQQTDVLPACLVATAWPWARRGDCRLSSSHRRFG